jgi:hypothetical protein
MRDTGGATCRVHICDGIQNVWRERREVEVADALR